MYIQVWQPKKATLGWLAGRAKSREASGYHAWRRDDVSEGQCWASTFCLLFLLGQIWQAVFWGTASTVCEAGFKWDTRPPLPWTNPPVRLRTHTHTQWEILLIRHTDVYSTLRSLRSTSDPSCYVAAAMPGVIDSFNACIWSQDRL